MSNNKTSIDKDLRKQKKRMREIMCLKSKPYEQLNDDQKAKLATENVVNRRINTLEKIISRQNNPTPTQTPMKQVKKNKNKKHKNNPAQKKNKNKMNKHQLTAYKRHNERSKKERNEQKKKTMSRKNKIAHFRSIRQKQEEAIGFLRMQMYLLKQQMNRDMEQTEQTTQETQAI